MAQWHRLLPLSSGPRSGTADFWTPHPKNEFELHLKPVEDFTLNAELVTEPVTDKEPSSNRFLQDVGAFVEDLSAQYDFEEISIFAGKFHPTFGRAWGITPGIHGTDLQKITSSSKE